MQSQKISRGAPSHASAHQQSRVIRITAIGAAATMVLLGLGYVGTCGYMAWTLTEPERQPFRYAPEQYGLNYETVDFPSRVDATPLDGWLLLPPAGAPRRRPLITVHGKGSDRTREAHDHLLEIGADLVRHGYPVLLFDLRGSGRSGGDHYTLGAKEVWDVGGAIDYLQGRGLAADLYEIRPIDHVAALVAHGVPLLVIHGEADTTIPFTHGQRIAAAYGPSVQTYFVPGAEHVRSYETDPATYLDVLERFFS